MRPPMPKPRLAEIEEIAQALIKANLQIIPDPEIKQVIQSLNLVL